ncbi:MAG: CHAP domain-containing protein [Chloroflexi bacterium]|nr:CHAP domain-containing protein [Chloroflexota bacterium]
MKLARVAAVERACTFVGLTEDPAGSNTGPRSGKWNEQINRWQKATNGVTGYAWCAAMQNCMLLDVGVSVHRLGLDLPSYVPSWVKWARARGYDVRRPLRGDHVCFDWQQDGTHDHIGIVDRVLALRWSKSGRFVGLIRTVEGNTSFGWKGSQSNGGCVARRWRWVNASTVFIRVPGFVPEV